MDEKIIYIIFIIAWGVYSYYRKSQKQKKQQQQTVDHSQQSTEQSPETKTSYKTILEKMLLGEEFTEPPKGIENGEWRMENEEVINSGIKKIEIPVEDKIADTVINEQTETSKVLKTFEVLKTKKFDLKQAVIYSVLLEKKFDKSNLTGF